MSRRSSLTLVFLAAALGATAIALALSAADRTSTSTPCNLIQLRVIRPAQGPGFADQGTLAQYLYVRFVNDGGACTLGPASGVTATATTNTHVVIRAKLTLRRTFLLTAHATHTFALGTWWQLENAHDQACRSAHFASVVFRIQGSSKTVRLPHPFNVCTPLNAELF